MAEERAAILLVCRPPHAPSGTTLGRAVDVGTSFEYKSWRALGEYSLRIWSLHPRLTHTPVAMFSLALLTLGATAMLSFATPAKRAPALEISVSGTHCAYYTCSITTDACICSS